MTGEHIFQIEALIFQGKSILEGLNRDLRQVQSTTSVEGEIASEFVGALAGEIFGTDSANRIGKKATRAFLKDQQIKQTELINNRYYHAYMAWFQEISRLVSYLSTNPSDLHVSKNGREMNNLVKIGRSIKLETRVRNTIAFLEELSANVKHASLHLKASYPALTFNDKQYKNRHAGDTKPS